MYQANVRYQQGIVSMEAGVTKAKQGSKQGLGGGPKEARDWMWDEWMRARKRDQEQGTRRRGWIEMETMPRG